MKKDTLEKKKPPFEKNENTSFEMKTHHNFKQKFEKKKNLSPKKNTKSLAKNKHKNPERRERQNHFL